MPPMIDMGERDAVRIQNSGVTVSHSVPGLRVGPTLPPTAGRKPEARPQVFTHAADRADGVKESRAAGLSQPKSAQGCGDRVPAISAEREAPALNLDDFSIAQIIDFFSVLDRWDQEAHGLQTM